MKEIHDDIDRAVFEAYGWSDLGEKLVGRPGATLPVDVKAPGQEEAEEELLSRLVALNRERAQEEKRGLVRWLRPDYQIPNFAKGAPKEEQIEADVEAPLAPVALPGWPKDQLEQIRLVRGKLLARQRPLPRSPRPSRAAAAASSRSSACWRRWSPSARRQPIPKRAGCS